MAHVLVVSDLPALRAELTGTLSGPDLSVEDVTTGQAALERVRRGDIDLVIVDMQVGAMGGMAITMELRHEESFGLAGPVPVLMLLDRRADVFLARRSTADGFVVKPLDALRLRTAVRALLRGESYEDESLRPLTVRVETATSHG